MFRLKNPLILSILLVLSFALAAVLPLGGKGQKPSAKQLSVNGTIIRYWERGRGVPVLFVHGAMSDHRYWEAQREAISKRYRYIAIDRRYFGTAPWPDIGQNNSQATHVADLAAFIRELKAGTVFLVGTSGGAQLSLIMTVQHPELVRGVFANEPGLRSILTNPADQNTVAEFDKRRVEAREKAKAGNMAEAARMFIDMAYGMPGTFDAEPPERKKMQVDNARTLTLVESTPIQITCAQLGQLKVPVTLTTGELTKTPSKIMTEAAHRCIRGSRLITIPRATHGAPWQNTSTFNKALLAFLSAPESGTTKETKVKKLRVNDVELAYVEEGKGEPIVLLHGGLRDYRQFSNVMEPLSAKYRVIAPSRRHHYPERWDGKKGSASTRQHVADLVAFLRKLNAGPVHLVGHSRGAGVALSVASTHPELLRTLTVLEGGGVLVPGDRQQSRQRFAQMMEMYEQGKMDKALAELFDRIHGQGAWSKTSEARRQGFRDNAWTIKGLEDADPYTCADAGRINVPILLVQGEKSTANFAKALDAVAGCVKDSKRVTIPNAGHNMTGDNPHDFVRALLDFISKH